jgi:tetratricopeptide (TPR) repeat protein
MKDALSLFEHATARDPLFARAFAGIALTWGKLATNGYEDFSVVSEKAEPAARRALELGPDLAEAHVAMATVDLLLDRFDDGVVEAEKAIQINPNLADARVSLGILYSHQRTLDDALREFQRAYELDPLSFHALHFLALAARVAGRFDIAFDILGKMKELSPSNPRVYIGLSECYLLQGDYTRSQEMLDAARQLGPAEPLVWLNQGVLYALTGRRREAEDILNRIASAERESIRLYGVLFIQTALGNLDEAYKALDRQAETHTWPFLLSVHPLFRELRKDPRYREFCKKVGIPY